MIISLIKSCFGSSYTLTAVLDEALMRRELADGTLTYALAEARVDGEWTNVGQVALLREAAGLYEHCRAVVDVRFRGLGLMERMSRLLLNAGACPRDGQLALGFSVTNHLHTQRYNESAGFFPLGVLLGRFPNLTVRGVEDFKPQNVSAVLTGLPLTQRSRRRCLQIRGRDQRRAERILDSLGIPIGAAPRRRSNRLGWVQGREDGGLRHYTFGAHGSTRNIPDPPESDRIQWADVPVEHPEAPRVVDRLRDAGFGFGAYVPLAGQHGADVMRLQRCFDTNLAELQVIPSNAWMLEDVLEDCGVHTVGAAA